MTLALLAQGAEVASRTPLLVVGFYLLLLIGLGVMSSRRFRGTSSDFFVAERSIGPFLLLMSVFGTTMTAFALVGSTGKAWELGNGVYGLMASASGIVHSAVFFAVGIKLWAIGKRHGFRTQVQYFRGRFQSPFLGYLLFPILVALVVPYLLIGLLGAGAVVRGITVGMFPDTFAGQVLPNGRVLSEGALPPWITGLVICAVVLFYIFAGGLRSAAWANAFQTIVFMITGLIAFVLISGKLGGLQAATQAVIDNSPDHMTRARIGKLQFATYMFVPLSVGMFPHLFQHWLTAKKASTFKLTTIAHPLFIGIVWIPCILIGIWAAGAEITPPGNPPNPNALLPKVVGVLLKDPYLTGLLMAGILAAIMSSLDSQFVCLGTMFTHAIVMHAAGEDRFSDRAQVMLGRGFIVFIVGITYLLTFFPPPKIFDLAVWCFSGFASLFPLVFASIYWRRTTKAGAIASVLAMVVTWGILFYEGLIAPTLAGEAMEGDYLVGGMMPVTLIFAASAIALVAVSLVTQPPPDDHVDQFMVNA